MNVKQDKKTLINELLLKNYNKYYRMAYSYVHNEADALDIVQESAYKAIFHADKLNNLEYADSWICRIIFNEGIEFLRKNRKYCAELETEVTGKEETYEDVDLKKAIEALSSKEKAVVVLKFYEDMSLEQIAWIVEENINTVKSRLYRALGKLKIALTQE